MSEQPIFTDRLYARYGRSQSSAEPAERPRRQRPQAAPRQSPRPRPAAPSRSRLPGARAIAGTAFARRPSGPVIPVVLLGLGAYLAWFGVHYWRSDVKWPTDPIKSVLQGKGLPANTATPTAEEAAASGQQGGAAGAGAAVAKGVAAAGAGPAAAAGQQAGSGATAAGNQQLGKMLAASYGWSTGAEWDDLVSLWNRESGWSNTADTRVTHAGGDNAQSAIFAYGIPQARPYYKMPKAAWPPDKGGSADPTHQINWGLADIKAVYGSPSKAWAHELAYNWY